MGKIVFVGVCHLRTSFDTYEQFISVFMERFLLLSMFISFYGTAPSYVLWSLLHPYWQVKANLCRREKQVIKGP